MHTWQRLRSRISSINTCKYISIIVEDSTDWATISCTVFVRYTARCIPRMRYYLIEYDLKGRGGKKSQSGLLEQSWILEKKQRKGGSSQNKKRLFSEFTMAAPAAQPSISPPPASSSSKGVTCLPVCCIITMALRAARVHGGGMASVQANACCRATPRVLYASHARSQCINVCLCARMVPVGMWLLTVNGTITAAHQNFVQKPHRSSKRHICWSTHMQASYRKPRTQQHTQQTRQL